MGTFTDYLAHFVALKWLRKLIDPNDGFDGPEYYREHILFAKAMEETFHVQPKTKRSGPRQFTYLATRRLGKNNEQLDGYNKNQREAQAFVHDALTNSSTMKLSHGYPGGKDFLPDLWDLPENENAGCESGTYAEYLRWGSVHLDQTKKLISYRIDNTKEKIYHVGVLEAVEGFNNQCLAT
jgi:hypothetical protein